MPINTDNIQIQRSNKMPISRQLYVQLHQQITHGAITFKEQLPGSRQLASQLNVSRGVIVECYDMLKTDGLVMGFGKGGTRVCYQLSPLHASGPGHSTNMSISRRGQILINARHYSVTDLDPLPLTPGVPDFSLFPTTRWNSLAREVMTSAPYWYQREGGIQLLRKTLQDYLRQYRGIIIDNPQRIIITSGTQASLSLLARLLCDTGDHAMIEDPCWSGSKASMLQAGLKLVHAPVDEQGANYAHCFSSTARTKPRIAVVTPAIQFPTGRSMSIQRRQALLQTTADNQCWLIEDDYAAEYSYGQHPAPSILSHHSIDHVIHVGTMSKLLMPALRIGWMVVPENLINAVTQASNTIGISPPYHLQQQLALFMQYGYLSNHLAHTRSVYNERRKYCSQYLNQHAQGILKVTESVSGMNLYSRLNPHKIDINNLSVKLKSAGLGCEIYTQRVGQKKEHFLLSGHANLNTEALQQHLSSLTQVLSS